MRMHSQDVQATYQILTLLERSKSQTDLLLELLPGICAVVNESGQVLSCNVEAANVLHLDVEGLIGESIQRFFREETWKIFDVHLHKLFTTGTEKVEFELSVDFEASAVRPFYWHIREFQYGNTSHGRLFSVVGSDISAMRNAERQLSDIFSNVPMGILTIDHHGKVVGRHSAYMEWLLGTSEIPGQHLKTLLSGHHVEGLAADEKNSIDKVLECLGQSELIFEILSQSFPKQIDYPISQSDGGIIKRYIGMSYLPIVYEGQVDRLLVVFQDQTELIRARLEEGERQQQEKLIVQRLLQIKRCPGHLLPIIIVELKKSFSKLEVKGPTRSLRDTLHTLHGAKGAARVAGLATLASLIHDLETEVISAEADASLDWSAFDRAMEPLSEEWREVESVYLALSARGGKTADASARLDISVEVQEKIRLVEERYSRIQSLGHSSARALTAERLRLSVRQLSLIPLSALEGLIRLQAEETAKQLNKSVELLFHWDGICVDEKLKSDLLASLLHLVTNALSHGLEAPEARLALGKPQVGRITISATELADWLRVSVSDDGAGLDPEKIKASALKKKVITLAESLELAKDDALQLIFKAGFSTADQVTEISGRGVGLDAVAAILKENGGKISAAVAPNGGALFEFTMSTGSRLLVQKVSQPARQFLDVLVAGIQQQSAEEGLDFELEINPAEMSKIKGLFYGDSTRLILSVTTALGAFAKGSGLIVKLGRDEESLVRCRAKRIGHPFVTWTEESKLEYELSLKACKAYVRQHGGEIAETDDQITIDFGHILSGSQLGRVFVKREEGVDPSKSEDTLDLIKSLCIEWGLICTTDPAGALAPLVISSGQAVAAGAHFLRVGASRNVVQGKLLKWFDSQLKSTMG